MKFARVTRSHHQRYANEKTLLTPEEWFEKEIATYALSGRTISRNVILSRILRRVTDKRERFFVRKYLSRWFDSWKRRSSGEVDNDDAVLSYLRSIIRYVITVVGVMTRKVLSHLTIATIARTFDDVAFTETFLRLLVTTHCSRQSSKHDIACCHRRRCFTIEKRHSDRSLDSKTSSLAHTVVKLANRVPSTIVRSIDVLKRASSWYRDENYDWLYIRMKFIDAFSQRDGISRSKPDDTNVCATVTWNVIE